MILPALLALALPIAGCGGGGDAPAQSVATPTASAPSPAQQRFVARGDAVCEQVNREILALKAKSAVPAEIERVVPRTILLERKGIAALQRLKPPASLERDWRLMLGYRRTLARELGALLDDTKNNHSAKTQTLAASKKHTHELLSKTAAADGFKVCGKIGRTG